ncbi:hypothetical protein [Daejeonella sp.]|jgi:hypothetical protein|uniref:hypothetical protein n=1 Tax=Daejeonella sp. TaxID=2805397 RepID=UPI0037846172
MKKIIICLFATLIYGSVGFAQFKGNTLTEEEYYAIKINDILIGDIIDTRGDFSKLKLMFGNDLQYKTYDKSFEVVEYWNNNIIVRFEEEDKTLTYVKLHYPITLTIKGKRIKIGDDVSALGLVKVDTSNGEYSIYFNDEETLTASFTIEVNPSTKKITKIYYILF